MGASKHRAPFILTAIITLLTLIKHLHIRLGIQPDIIIGRHIIVPIIIAGIITALIIMAVITIIRDMDIITEAIVLSIWVGIIGTVVIMDMVVMVTDHTMGTDPQEHKKENNEENYLFTSGGFYLFDKYGNG
jgi:hypothetical protein